MTCQSHVKLNIHYIFKLNFNYYLISVVLSFHMVVHRARVNPWQNRISSVTNTFTHTQIALTKMSFTRQRRNAGVLNSCTTYLPTICRASALANLYDIKQTLFDRTRAQIFRFLKKWDVAGRRVDDMTHRKWPSLNDTDCRMDLLFIWNMCLFMLIWI